MALQVEPRHMQFSNRANGDILTGFYISPTISLIHKTYNVIERDGPIVEKNLTREPVEEGEPKLKTQEEFGNASRS